MNENSINLDDTDLQLLQQLQLDASLSNQALARHLDLSAPTCLRRVKRLQELGLIEKQVAILSSEHIARLTGHGLQAIVEVSLDRQDSSSLMQFERKAVAENGAEMTDAEKVEAVEEKKAEEAEAFRETEETAGDPAEAAKEEAEKAEAEAAKEVETSEVEKAEEEKADVKSE